MRINPITRKRWQRFRKMRRAWFSFWLLLLVYGFSLAAELLCNSNPLLLVYQGRIFFPFCKFYAEDLFTGNGRATRPDYRKLAQQQDFQQSAWILWAPVVNDPFRSVPVAELEQHLRIFCRLTAVPRVAGISIDQDFQLIRALGLKTFGDGEEPQWQGKKLQELWEIPQQLQHALEARFAGTNAQPQLEMVCTGKQGLPSLRFILLPSQTGARRSVRMTLREDIEAEDANLFWTFPKGADSPRQRQKEFAALPSELRQQILAQVHASARKENPPVQEVFLDGRSMKLSSELEQVRFPFRPTPGHWLGLDDAGRDVFARILYGLRSSLSFGLILVFCAMAAGTMVGMLQGYLGGWVDITGQRLIEIWSALPFLYIMILMGSIYGPGFQLLIFCYAIFNWIGISYYMRAEMLRLRRLPFVEAARCLGLPGWKIALRHILPNSLVPLITFFPFSLVGAIGSLAALDYLGFGLPPPTPSLGQLLQQAQNQRWAWWLTLYPSLTLFIIMLLGVFIGEGLRNAFDPKRQSRLQ
ncbi:MAG: ABC transporter permease subunit [Lentisphaeria bacterium]|nr:ABC transporter permease subunit [Lentisphaeria bacterium]